MLFRSNKQADVYVTQDELDSTVFVILDGTGEREGGIQELKVGDNILLERSYYYSVDGTFDAKRSWTKITKVN